MNDHRRLLRVLAILLAGAALACAVALAATMLLSRDDTAGESASLRVTGNTAQGQPTGNVETEGGQQWLVCDSIPLAPGTVVDGSVDSDGASPVSTGGVLPRGTFVGRGLTLKLVAIGPNLPCGGP